MMFGMLNELRLYILPSGKIPFEEWLNNLQDIRGRANIRTRLDRLQTGNPGNYRPLGDEAYELKIAFGPGYRVYFGMDGLKVILLLCGGNKRSQKKDITKAKQYWQQYRSLK